MSEFDDRLRVIDEGTTLAMGVPPAVVGTTQLDVVLAELAELRQFVAGTIARLSTVEALAMAHGTTLDDLVTRVATLERHDQDAGAALQEP